VPFTPSSCIKVATGLHTYQQADETCFNLFEEGVDLFDPHLPEIASAAEQQRLESILRSPPFSSIQTFWLGQKKNEALGSMQFAKWTPGSPSNHVNRTCIEIRNELTRASWVDVNCERVNAVICVKTRTIPYAELINAFFSLVERVNQTGGQVVKLRIATQENVDQVRLSVMDKIKDDGDSMKEMFAEKSEVAKIMERIVVLERDSKNLYEIFKTDNSKLVTEVSTLSQEVNTLGNQLFDEVEKNAVLQRHFEDNRDAIRVLRGEIETFRKIAVTTMTTTPLPTTTPTPMTTTTASTTTSSTRWIPRSTTEPTKNRWRFKNQDFDVIPANYVTEDYE